MILFWILFILGFLPLIIILPVRVFGRKNLPKQKNAIYVCNHFSNFDPIIIDIKLKKRLRFLAKKELFKSKAKSFFLTKIFGAVKVDRGAADIESTKNVLNLLKNKKSICIFPEGTRVESEDENLALKNGTAFFAVKSKTQIVPMYIAKKQKAFKKNILIIGKPFELTEFYDKKINKELLNSAGLEITKKMQEIKDLYKKFEHEGQVIKKIKEIKDKK